MSKYKMIPGSFEQDGYTITVGLWTDPGNPGYYQCSVQDLLESFENDDMLLGDALSKQREYLETGKPSVLTKVM